MPMIRKAFTILMVSMAVMFGSLFLITRSIAARIIERIEIGAMEKNVHRAARAVDRELVSLEIKFRDWSSWDDMYEFAKDANPKFIESNFKTSAIITGQFNVIAVVGNDGRYVFRRAVNLDYGADMDVSPEEWEKFRKAVEDKRKKSPDGARGIFLFDKMPMMTVVLPILPSDKEGPARGVLVAGKIVNSAIVRQVAEDLALPINIWPLNDRFTPDEAVSASNVMTNGNKSYIQIIDKKNIAGYARIDDMDGNPALIAGFHQPREISIIAGRGFEGLIIICSLIALFMITATLTLLHFKIAIPLKGVIGEIISVADSSDHSRRVSVEKNSDFGKLSKSINRMITALEASQEALLKIRKAIESSSDAIGMADPSGRHFFQNKAFTDLFGYSVDDLSKEDMPICAYEDEKVGLEIFRTIMGGNSWRGETIIVSKSGRHIPVSVRADAIKDDKGNIIGLVGIHTDISKRREIERMKSDFVANVSHELRTPLTSLRGSLGLLSSGVMGELTGEVKELIEVARLNAERLTRLINDILDLQKMDSGTMRMELKNVSLGEIVGNSISEMAALLEAQNINIAADSIPFRVRADSDRVIQVLDNLISNSVKFSPPGSEIRVFAVEEKDFIRVFVQDKGEGVPDEFADKIFERFQQADASSTRKYGGTGLGLSICKNIVESHGGEIRYEPTSGGGATFSFTLKIASDSEVVARNDEVA